MTPLPKKKAAAGEESTTPTSMRLDRELLADVRAHYKGALSGLVSQLLRAWLKEAKRRQVVVKAERQRVLDRLAEVRVEWWQCELARARKDGNADAIKHYETLLAGGSA